jgi:gliding motility-associated-like protein
MADVKYFLLVFAYFFMTCHLLMADPLSKKNLGFENGNFDGWTGYTWTYSTTSDVGTSFNTSPSSVSLPTSRRHVIMSDQNAYDSNTGNLLKKIPEGYTYSARLGDEITSSDSKPRCWQQSLKYTMTVDSSNAFVLMKFACVLEYSAKHDNITEMEPRFQLALYDEEGNDIEDCSNYNVYASGDMENEFNTYNSSSNGNPVKWRDWTTVGADLSAYIGQDITIEFLSADCTGHYHFGYAYFVVDCMPLYITVDYCTDDTYATFEAPDGFDIYTWYEEDSTTVAGYGQNLEILSPNEGDIYFSVMESETGCEVSLSSTVARYEPEVDFDSEMTDCKLNTVMFQNNSTTNNGSLTYLWDFGDGNTSEEENPEYTFQTSGVHDVGLIIYNPPSGCTDTLYKEVESFSPPLVGFTGDSTYCPGLETELTAYGAYRYEWSTGDSAQTISIGDPGGTFWFVGYSSLDVCYSDTSYITITEEPDWDFALFGDSSLCEGTDAILFAEGASEYLWSTGETNDSILIYQGNTYTVTGTNVRACQKELSIYVYEVPIPTIDYSLSTNTIDSRNNAVECSVTSDDDDVVFQWNMGDGTVVNSGYFTYTYPVSSELISYAVTVSATNEYGCTNAITAYVAEDIFIPNVFTPNSDGINDLFMSGYQQKVFDRNGIVLYNGESGWDGLYNGANVDPDTYFYILNYLNAYGEERVRRGFVTLVR